MTDRPIAGEWTFTYRQPHTGLITRQIKKHNLITDWGVDQISAAIGGGYIPPAYLAMEAAAPTLYANTSIGNTTFTSTYTALPNTGVLCMGLGTANQENVTCTSIVGSGTVTYTISPGFTKSHALGDIFTLIPTTGSTGTDNVIQAAIQYDSINNPGQWMQTIGGYQSGVGQYTLSFFFTAPQALAYITKVGLIDDINIGSGGLHSYLLYGQDHTAGIEDLQIDCLLTATTI